MNIFVDGEFYKGEFEEENGTFTAVRKLGPFDRNDPDLALPGFIDIHTHGRNGEDFSFAGEREVEKLLKSYARCGVTGVLATTMTNRRETVERSVSCEGLYARDAKPGMSVLLGINLEGPFLGRDKKGAHDEQFLSDFDKNWLDLLIEKSNNNIRMITIDPRLPGSSEFIVYCRKCGISVSLGHTSADYETAVRACDDGADHVTHLFNAMEPVLHRAPGLIGAAYDRKMFSEIICDGIHVSPTVIRMCFGLMPDRMCLISDSMQAAGLCDGDYMIGGLDVKVEKGKATLRDGTIAGSTTDVYSAFKNAVAFGIPAGDAILAATYNPARSIGLEERIGSIKPGCFADWLLTDTDYNIKKITIHGRTI